MRLTVINADGNKRTYSSLMGRYDSKPKYAFRHLANGCRAIPVEFLSHEQVYDDSEAMAAIVRENLDEDSVCRLED